MTAHAGATAEGRSASTRWSRFAGPALLALVAAAHADGMLSSFTWDDAFVLLNNAHVRSFDLAKILFERVWSGAGIEAPYWRPLTSLSFGVQHAISGLLPWPFHLINIAIHLTATALLFAIARQVTGSALAAFAGAAVFGVHPIQVEVVSGIANRGDALVAVFGLAALLAYARSDAPTVKRSLLASLGLAAACLSKETGITVMAPLLVWDVAIRGRSRWRQLAAAVHGRLGRAWAGFALVSGGYLVAHRAVAGAMGSMEADFLRNPIARAPFWTQKLLALSALGRALRLLCWPARLSADYSYRSLELDVARARPDAAIGAAVVVLLAVVAVRAMRRAPLVTIGVAFAGAAWLPVSNLLFPIEVMMAERFYYVPLAGFGLAVSGVVVWALEAARPSAMRAALVAGAVVVAALGIRTALRGLDWRDQRALIASAVAAYPENAKMQLAWAQMMESAGDHAAAEDAYRRAVVVWPEFAAAWSERAEVLRELGRPQEALAAASRAVQLDSGDFIGWFNLAIELEHAGALEQALAALREGAARNPGNAYLSEYIARIQRRLQARGAGQPGVAP